MAAPSDHARTEDGVVEAAVQVGSRVTEYARCGRGRTVLLLADGGRRHLPPDPLLRSLAQTFRVIAATVPEGDAPAWLHGLVEGLGVAGPDVVVRGEGSWMEGFLADFPGQVGRVLILGDGGAEASDADVTATLLRND